MKKDSDSMFVDECDYHFFFLWAVEKGKLTMYEFKEFLRTFPNSENALNIADRFISYGCGDIAVEDVI